MLKRRSIRTKLIVAMTLLSAIVLLLASSGFWGLHRYRRLSKAVSQRAHELGEAHALHRSATDLLAANQRIDEYNSRRGMIDSLQFSDPLIDMRESEVEAYITALLMFDGQVHRHLKNLLIADNDVSLLIDSDNQIACMEAIVSSLNELPHVRVKEGLSADGANETHSQFAPQHEAIVKSTNENLQSIQQGLEDFSGVVRGQYNLWIVIAYSCTILAFVMVGILVGVFRSLVVKPFRTLVDGSRLVAGGQFDHRIDLGTGDELSELAEAMNDMTDRFQKALAKVNSWCTDLDRQVQDRTREVIQNEQLASVGFLAAGVAHEINNPLASIAWSAESLQSRAAELTMLQSGERKLDDEMCESLLTNLRRIEDEAYRCKGITEKLLDFSRLSEVQRAPTDLAELVTDVVSMVGTVGKYRCKTVRVHSSDAVIASINPQEIRQVVLNLVTNALESVDCDGAVDVSIAQHEQRVSVIVKDTGCGMSQEVLKHLFEPFFTRRRDGTGTGLGLSITYRIVSQHGGSLIAQSKGEGQGSTLEMLLPLSIETDDSDVRTTNGMSYDPYQAA